MTNASYLFGSSLGSENFYRHSLSAIIYTDGVKDLADQCQAYWLIDLIISHQQTRLVNEHPFQVWELIKQRDGSFVVEASDGNGEEIARQEITYSDFPYDKAGIWLVDGCLLMPNEY